ncbi:hypothetical protein HaLaN_27981, partial [Haematococcus lacustris]
MQGLFKQFGTLPAPYNAYPRFKTLINEAIGTLDQTQKRVHSISKAVMEQTRVWGEEVGVARKAGNRRTVLASWTEGLRQVQQLKDFGVPSFPLPEGWAVAFPPVTWMEMMHRKGEELVSPVARKHDME